MPYTEQKLLAAKLIAEKGKNVTFRKVSDSNYNPVTDTASSPVTSTFQAPAVFLPLVTGQQRDRVLVENASLLGQKCKVLLAAVDSDGDPLATPEIGDQIIRSGDTSTPHADWWTIESIGTLEPDVDPILYTIVATRGATP